MSRFIDKGISSLSLLKPEVWVHCPTCQMLAKIVEIKEEESEGVKVFCTQCTYRKSLQGEFKHEVRQFQKPYDNQQAEQISLMV